MLQQNQDNIDDIWKIIKQVRKSFLIDGDDLECKNYDNQITEDNVMANVYQAQVLTLTLLQLESKFTSQLTLLQSEKDHSTLIIH